jgi:arylsulfatase A-like enzyme
MTNSRLQAVAKLAALAFAWLGLSTAAWALVLAIELSPHGAPPELGKTAAHLPAIALRTSALFSVVVLAVHMLRFALLRFTRRALGWVTVALCAAAAMPSYELSAFLTEGAWIASQPYVRVVQTMLFLMLLGGWLGAWLFHAFATVAALRPRWAATGRRALAFHIVGAAAGAGAIASAILLLSSVLRPYGALGERLLFPTWLIAATLAFRLYTLQPRPALVAALVVLAGASGASGYRALHPESASSVRAYALSAGGFAALTEQRAHPLATERLSRFDFQSAQSIACPTANRLPPLALEKKQRRNVILLSIDTLRRDAIGKRIAGRAVAPNLTAFSKESVFFDRAVAPAPITLYSIGSLLTGYSVGQLLYLPGPPDNLFKRTRPLFDRQYIVLPDWSVMRRHRLASLIKQRTPTEYVPREADPTEPFLTALAAARDREQRVFFWLHLVEPHAPYREQRGFEFGDTPVEKYYSEVAYDDALLGRVLTALREAGWFDDSLIAIFSDHGESLGEDGYFGHGVSVAGRFTDVPLWVRYPGVQPRRSSAPVSVTNLATTVLHYLDQEVPATFVGCSLLRSDSELADCPWPASTVFGLETRTFDEVLDNPVATLADLDRRQTYMKKRQRFPPDVAIASADFRYVFDLASGQERLYDRARDPAERHDLMATRPDLVRSFRAQFAQWHHNEARRIVCQLGEGQR